jgi:exopolyphosphatase/pppGpp-phosphohydrolase
VVLAAVLERIGAREARVSGRGIRYGVLAELLGRGA